MKSRNRISGSALAAVAAMFFVPNPASANDGDLQRVLNAASCPSATLKVVYRQSETTVYEANCFSSSHKVIVVECRRGMCRLDAPARDQKDG